MASKPVNYPGLVSVPRFTTLLVSLLVTLGSGTNYVYSVGLTASHYTHTQLNIVALAGNIGVHVVGPIWGRIIDLHGPRIVLASAFVLFLSGYSGIRYIFDAGLDPTSTTISASTFLALVLCGFMTGVGANAGVNSAINSTAKTFPDKVRATATGVVNSGFGLSAFLFSMIARVAFADNTSSFLLLLSIGTSIPMILGFFFVRPIPLPPTASGTPEERRRQALIPRNDEDGETSALLAAREVPEYVGLRHSTTVQLSRQAALDQGLPANVYGYMLWTSSDFWLLFAIFSLLAGTGLTFINNVGSMSRALYIKSTEVYNPIDAARWQATQVSTISVLNASSRIFIGLVSDYAKIRFQLPRSYSLVLVSTMFFISQVTAVLIVDVQHLWMASAILGLAHGGTYSLLINVCLEWFGIIHLSENWGFLSFAPVIAANLFSIVFGRNLDAHDNPSHSTTSRGILTATSTTCKLGRECYVDALYLTMGACLLAMVLSVWAGWRDRILPQGQTEAEQSISGDHNGDR